ncbi:MAG: lytic murein transglycosylase [Methylobacterium mesophilicum]|nr:lytic murein transglycosylase [Methylobacterium mesophilicum]
MRIAARLLLVGAALAASLPAWAQAPDPAVPPTPPLTEAELAAKAACGGEFSDWLGKMRAEAQGAGIGATGLSALDNARQDPKVLDRDRSQSVFSQTFTQFSGRMISAYRLKQGAANLKKYADVFQRAETQFGVPGPVIAAFWALETDFGAVQGDFLTLDALVTLSHDCRRPQLFRPQIVPLLTLIDRGDLPADTKGAWAGEVGQTQMLPSDILKLGQDGDGDGHVDMRNDPADVIMTTAAKIKSRGWRPNEPWIEEARVPDALPWDQTGRTNKLPIKQWSDWGVTYPDSSPLRDNGLQAGLVIPQGYRGPAFITYANYDVYLEWNQSAVYTLTAANLATRLAGAPKFDPRSPEDGLDLETMKQLQTKLESRGYHVGGVDGILGTATREAVRQEQIRLGMVVDGWPTPELLARL